jgi:hypothetical protein
VMSPTDLGALVIGSSCAPSIHWKRHPYGTDGLKNSVAKAAPVQAL